jgi:hypothetical protein
MPPGEVYDALRGALYFSGAGVGRPVIVLCGWLLGGLVLLLLGQLLARRGRSNSAAE